ncbi:DUF262 domain-containing protein [Sphingomonas mucosissima]|uniref:GmrSD restriction endonucleases N-terminal domain-containing protein n=1 Tax=Sphingomonas mucosissima TaxID=370959 RepID=A0A245ZGU4_9SPHN|nr:DUF262 domain-containing protein [Sphingomonas mucosissima]OWK28960.1 hypothetical protein SPMU_24860 [Sphingomonas mucosissima]
MAIGNVAEIERRFDQSQNDLVLQTSDFSLQGLKDMVDNQIIDLAPKYQRRERWEVERQSELIESFLLNVPVPPIYLAEEEYGVYSIIDGKQRITAVSDYLNNVFSLKGLEEFPELNGARFRELPRTLQNALRVRPYLRVITLLKQSHPRLKYEVFIRLNRGGIQLNNQEIRNVAFRGPLNDAIYDAADNKLLKSALKIDGPKSAAYQQMQDAEYVLRFLTLNGTWEKFSGSLSKSMDAFMLEHSNARGKDLEDLILPFERSMARTARLWGDTAFQRWDGQKWRRQALAGLYDAEMIAAALLTDVQVATVSARRPDVLEATKALFAQSEFEEAVRLGTNTPSRIRSRIEQTYGMLLSLA